MELPEIVDRARSIRRKYAEFEKAHTGKSWSPSNLAQGFVGDVGDLMKLVMAKEGLREIEDVDAKLAHELADCLWSVLVLADAYNVDIEAAFTATMDELDQRLDGIQT